MFAYNVNITFFLEQMVLCRNVLIVLYMYMLSSIYISFQDFFFQMNSMNFMIESKIIFLCFLEMQREWGGQMC